ncbi:hypothetical protein SLE2022_354850 [Rubroshorea leprosula]
MKAALHFHFSATVFFLVIVLSHSGFDPALAAALPSGNEKDKLALLAFKDRVHQDPLDVNVLNSWNESTHFCDWPGVSCSRRHRGRVTGLNLMGQKLGGSLPRHIGNLTFLRRLNLGGNRFRGEIPQELGRLFRLRHLNLSYNGFQGEIPNNLSLCLNLQAIDLNNNYLVGSIPIELKNLSRTLQHLRFSSNNLTGTIPHWLGNASSLLQLSFLGNNLHGSIPAELGKLSSLFRLNLGINNLGGMVPPAIFNLSSLFYLDIASNQLRGNIPLDIGFSLPNLIGLYVGRNLFNGPIPVSLPNASQLVEFDFAYGYFSGTVPQNLGSLSRLRRVALADNRLETGEDEGFNFLTSLTNCSNLQLLDIGKNQLKGELPASIANFSTKFQVLRLDQNQISGSIPTDIGNLVGLTYLRLSQNFFTGEIPSSIVKLKSLSYLSLSGNRISGSIPASIGNMTRLLYLTLSNNNLAGEIPPAMGNCRNLLTLTLWDNNLTGKIPEEITNSSTYILNLAQNSLTGPLPLEVGNLGRLVELDVSYNRLSGGIPSTLGKCVMLERLRMQDNLFEGSIPPSFSALKSLSFLDLSRNNFSGQIPNYLQNFTLLQNLNLSFNNFQGEVPYNGIFKNVSNISVVGNENICGGIQSLGLLPCKNQDLDKRRRSLNLKMVIPVSVSCAILLMLVILFIFSRLRKSGRKAPIDVEMHEQFPMISYAELSQATNEFSPSNLIGEGSYSSVYKGIMAQEGRQIAVKVLNLQQKGASKSFMAECEALRNVRHRNLIKIMTVCSSIDFKGNDFKAIVYEFMQNGSLEEFLHPNEGEVGTTQNFNFIQRLNVAIEAASAIEYLHHHCQPPIVHGDLKPSNVLLNDQMVAHVGDFGLSRILQESRSARMNTSSAGIRGTVGYVAPEYGMGGKASTAGDVYSFGILLLEMITARRPTDPMFNNGLTLHQYAKTAVPEGVMDILEPILSQEAEADTRNNRRTRVSIVESLVAMVRIGVLCSTESPNDRMQIKDVVIELCKIREKLLG